MSVIQDKRLLGVEDIRWDDGGHGANTPFTTPGGDELPLHHVNASHIPVTDTSSLITGANNVDDALIRLNKAINAKGSDQLNTDTTVSISLSMTEIEIQEVINAQPRNLGGHKLTFAFPSGKTYNMNQTLSFKGFYSGSLAIEASYCRFNALNDIPGIMGFYSMMCSFVLRNAKFDHDQGTAVWMDSCVGGYVSGCRFTGNPEADTVAIQLSSSDCQIRSCTYDGDIEISVASAQTEYLEDKTKAVANNLQSLKNKWAADHSRLESVSAIASAATPKISPVTPLVGQSVSVSPSHTYSYSASGTCVINVPSWSADDVQQIASMYLDIQQDGVVSCGNNLSCSDTLWPGTHNYVVFVGRGNKVRMYVVWSEDMA